MKKVLLGIIIGVIMTISTSVLAEDGLEQVVAYLRPDLPIELDGQRIQLESSPVMYEGSTYLKLRDVAAVTYMHVEWNEQTQTVELYSQGAPEPIPGGDEVQKQEQRAKSLRFRELTTEINDLNDKIGDLYDIIRPYEVIDRLSDGTLGTKEKDEIYQENKNLRDSYIQQRDALQQERDEISEYLNNVRKERLEKERAELETAQ